MTTKTKAKTKKTTSNGRVTTTPPEKVTREIIVSDPNLEAYGELTLEIEGTAPLLMHRFSEKAKAEMLAKQQGKAPKKKPPKNPDREFLDSFHVIGDRPKENSPAALSAATYGFPASAFKAAAVRAAKLAGLAMTDARAYFFVEADNFVNGEGLIELVTPEIPWMHEGWVRITGTTDLRYRGMFDRWGAKLRVTFNSRLITPDALTSLFRNAGVCNGIGEMRPGGKQSSGTLGTWKVSRAVAEVPNLEDSDG